MATPKDFMDEAIPGDTFINAYPHPYY